MRSKKRQAVTSVKATAQNYNRQNGAYRKPTQLSNLKMFIGELLIFGNKQRKEFWWMFDSKVRKFYELKMYEGKQ